MAGHGSWAGRRRVPFSFNWNDPIVNAERALEPAILLMQLFFQFPLPPHQSSIPLLRLFLSFHRIPLPGIDTRMMRRGAKKVHIFFFLPATSVSKFAIVLASLEWACYPNPSKRKISPNFLEMPPSPQYPALYCPRRWRLSSTAFMIASWSSSRSIFQNLYTTLVMYTWQMNRITAQVICPPSDATMLVMRITRTNTK